MTQQQQQQRQQTIRVETVTVINEGKVKDVPIRTGIGYLDHMIDQFNSHAQVGVGLTVVSDNINDNGDSEKPTIDEFKDDNYDPNRFATQNQVELCTVVGSALGGALYRNVLNGSSRTTTTDGCVSRFCCPLDEALVECVITSPEPGSTTTDDAVSLTYNVAPYGIYPKGGRTHIGSLETFAIESFWNALSKSSHLNISFTKIRGDNAHHIVESSFKAFSRALRNYLDEPNLWTVNGPNHQATLPLARVGQVKRSTKETSISVSLCLDPSNDDSTDSSSTSSTINVQTGIPTLDMFYETLAKEAHIGLQIDCNGDRWVDDHHTAEDVSIAIGQCLTQALGSKAGLNRMWVATSEICNNTSATVEVTMDLSNRPCFVHNLHDTLSQQEYVDWKEVDSSSQTQKNKKTLLTCEMLEHCLDSLVMNGRMTVHVVETRRKVNSTTDSNDNNNNMDVCDVTKAIAEAFGRALRICSMVDPRRAGATASSKGTLSV